MKRISNPFTSLHSNDRYNDKNWQAWSFYWTRYILIAISIFCLNLSLKSSNLFDQRILTILCISSLIEAINSKTVEHTYIYRFFYVRRTTIQRVNSWFISYPLLYTIPYFILKKNGIKPSKELLLSPLLILISLIIFYILNFFYTSIVNDTSLLTDPVSRKSVYFIAIILILISFYIFYFGKSGELAIKILKGSSLLAFKNISLVLVISFLITYLIIVYKDVNRLSLKTINVFNFILNLKNVLLHGILTYILYSKVL